ncbi:kinase-like domain-containing protein [Mycena galopus ATCC 62051]|nr:kinase-like domain-containing protein [Mycena galopus ATCC 62051]
MQKRLKIITTALDKQSPSRPSPTRSPLSAIVASELRPLNRSEPSTPKKSIRQVTLERRFESDSDPTHNARHLSIRKRTLKLWATQPDNLRTGRNSAGMERGQPFKWIRGQVIKRRTHGGVYLGLNTTTGEMMAVKQIGFPQNSGELPGRPSARTFKRELENMKTLRHLNLTEYLGLEDTGGVLTIFMEYVTGGSIKANLRKFGTFDANVIKSFTSQIINGLIYLHSKGLVHGALKSSNILVEPTGTCKIEGLCCSETEVRDNSRAIPRAIFWTAPEIVRTQFRKYDSKADIWSLGCIVLEMLTAKRPWFDTEAVAVMFKLYQQTLRPHPPDDMTLDPVAANLMEQCLALKPEDRLSGVQLKQHPFLVPPPEYSFPGFILAV